MARKKVKIEPDSEPQSSPAKSQYIKNEFAGDTSMMSVGNFNDESSDLDEQENGHLDTIAGRLERVKLEVNQGSLLNFRILGG